MGWWFYTDKEDENSRICEMKRSTGHRVSIIL
jgi:hypothetical protein